MISVWLLTYCLGLAAVPEVRLENPTASIEVKGGERALVFSARVHNDLSADIDSVELVLVLRRAAGDGAPDNPVQWLEQAPPPGIRVRREHLAVRVAAHSTALAVARWSLDEILDAGSIGQISTHVLGFHLATFDAALLQQLLASGVAANEVAACAVLGIGAPRAEQAALRHQLSGAQSLALELAQAVTQPVAARPTQENTFARIFALLGLAVMGESSLNTALASLPDDAALARFDEPLQIAQIARAQGSAWQAPLAFALPPSATHMRDVVAFAKNLAEQISATSPVLVAQKDVPTMQQAEQVAPSVKTPRQIKPVWLLLALVSVIGCLFLLRRWRRK